MHKRRRVLSVWLILLALSIAHAAETDVDTLEQEIQALRRQVRELRARMDALEQKQQSAYRVAAPGSEPAAPKQRGTDADPTSAESVVGLKQRWSKVARGMSGAEVASAIGEPTAKLILDGRPVWYYIYAGVGRGSVLFDGGGRVSSLQAPAVVGNR